MKHLAILCCLFLVSFSLQAQPAFTVALEELAIPELPGKQSFVWGQHNGLWLIIGGRTDGLHRPQPFAAFLPEGNNTEILLIDPTQKRFWKAGLTELPLPLQEQLQSSNMNFVQRGSTLYTTGGYSYAESQKDHITHSLLVAIDLPGLIEAMQSGASPAPHFRSVEHPALAVAGGQMTRLGDVFYLVGGHKFTGVYNPIGPDNGPGFVQEYTNAIRKFKIEDNGEKLQIKDFSETTDSLQLHRRDYNLVAQVFPDGHRGFTAFSGVFQYDEDLPWLNAVDIDSLSYQPIPDFEQLFNHYHCATLPIHESASNKMHTLFFGGLAQYYLDSLGDLVNDVNVPFVKAISKVTRFPDGRMVEYDTGKRMPAFLGTGSFFIPHPNAPYLENNVLDLDRVPPGKHLAGHIYGGIECGERNILFTQTGVESWSSPRIFAVYIEVKDRGE